MAKQVEHLTMSKEVVEVGDRAGEGNAHGNLGLVSSMVVIYLQKCTWCTSPPSMRAKRTRRWRISKSTSGVCYVALAPDHQPFAH
jgi:hypothetical protein